MDRGTALLVELRSYHRATTASTRRSRAHTAETKAHMDRQQLQLHNLQYERQHLLDQIEACRRLEYVAR